MFDINTVINTALNAAVQAALQPIQQAHAEQISGMAQRLFELTERVAALETQAPEKTLSVSAEALMDALDRQEWFWEKLTRKANEVVEDKLDAHCSEYDHDDFELTSDAVDALDLDDLITKDAVRDIVRDVINDASFTVSVDV